MPSPRTRMSTQEVIDTLGAKLSKKNFKSTRQNKLDELDMRLQKLVAIVRGKRNALQAVHKLPPEVLVNIFLRVQQHLPSFLPIPLNRQKYDYRNRDWLTSSPFVDNGGVLSQLRRSGESTLTVFYGIRKPLFFADEIQLLTPHIRRIRELHLGLSRWTDSISTIFHALSSPALTLESLTIDTHGGVSAGHHLLPLFDDKMPRLRKLCLEFFSSWPTNYFTGLTHVCLHHQATPHFCRPTSTEFLNFLESSPLLEELILVHAGPTREQEEDIHAPDPWRRVRLSQLRQLSWGKIEDMLHVRRLLFHLSLPETTKLYFWGSSNADGGDLANLIPSDLTHLPCMSNMSKWRLRCSYQPSPGLDHGSYLVAFVEETLYTLNISWESYIARLPSVYAPIISDVRELYVLDSINLSSDLWKDIFRALPRLVSLMIQPPQQWTSSRGILGALYPDDSVHSGGLKQGIKAMLRISDALCPSLRSLSIEADHSFQGFFITVFAKARMKHGCPLHRLELRHLRAPTSIYIPVSTQNGRRLKIPISPPETIGASGITPVEQARLDMEDRFSLQKSVKEVLFSYDQEVTVMEPESWPTAGYTWTMMTLPSDN